MNSPLRILIIEDEPLIAEDIADLCKLNGYEVCETIYNAAAALSAIQTHQPNLVLIDINLQSTIDGVDIAEHLKRNYMIPFIFITSYADKHTLAKAREVGPVGYIVKPFSKAQLYSTIEIACEQLHKLIDPSLDITGINKRLDTSLSVRETEVLNCIFKGMDTAKTAKALFISNNTVKFHLKNLYDKFDVNSRTELLVRIREWTN